MSAGTLYHNSATKEKSDSSKKREYREQGASAQNQSTQNKHAGF